jgi:hypothetical protein
MPSPTHTRLALALALGLTLNAVAHGQGDADASPADPDPPNGHGFGWVCFATAVAAVGGLYVLVRRREQAAEANWRRRRGPEAVWYCRACARDVGGPVCPHCRATNPFLHEPADADLGTWAGRVASRPGDGMERGPRRQRSARDVSPPDTSPDGHARDPGETADPGDRRATR